jgi:hypothetical protein
MSLSCENSTPNTTDCPSAEILLEFQRNRLSSKEGNTIRRHIAGCMACAHSSLLIAKTLGQERKLIVEMRHKYSRNAFLRSRFIHYSIPLGLLTVLIAIIIFNNTQEHTIFEEHQTRGIELTTIESIQVLNVNDDIILKWINVPTCQYYIVEIFDNSLKLFWRSTKIYEESISLPNNIKEVILAGKQYAWIVTAYLSDERTIKSALTEFRIQ